MVTEINKKTFDEAVGGLSIVDFFTPDCPTCQKLSTVFERVSEKAAGVAFFKVDLEDDITLAERFAIDHIPSLMLMKDGVPIKTNVGYLDDEQLTAFIASANEQ